jgi:hypothetical protein
MRGPFTAIQLLFYEKHCREYLIEDQMYRMPSALSFCLSPLCSHYLPTFSSPERFFVQISKLGPKFERTVSRVAFNRPQGTLRKQSSRFAPSNPQHEPSPNLSAR